MSVMTEVALLLIAVICVLMLAVAILVYQLENKKPSRHCPCCSMLSPQLRKTTRGQ